MRTLRSDSLRQTLDAMRKAYDLVLLDTPPVLLVPDALIAARLADAILLISESGRNDPKDIEEFGCRGGGPGGQNVNKVETGWFIRYKRSGLTFKITEMKSQGQNKERAWSLLRSTLYEAERRKQHDAQTSARKTMMGSGDRSQRIRTYNFPQNRVTDHRIGVTVHQLPRLLEGDLDPLVEPLLTHYEAQRMAEAARASD